MSREPDERELAALFSELDTPAGVDRWRERVADTASHEHDDVVVPLRPDRFGLRSVAVAAAVAAVVGLGGVVVASGPLGGGPDPRMIIDGPARTTTTPPPSSSPVTSPGR